MAHPVGNTPDRPPVVDGGSFAITHLSTDPEGYNVSLTGVGRTALLGDSLAILGDPEIPKKVRAAVWEEMRFAKLPLLAYVAEKRLSAHQAEQTGDSQAVQRIRENIQQVIGSGDYATQRFQYVAGQGLGKKIGFRNLMEDPDNSNLLTGSAQLVPFYMYNRFSSPIYHREALGHLSEAAAVTLALVTADNRLILQHRAVSHRNLLDGKMSGGNASYNDIPGASAAGWIDAAPKKHGEKDGTPPDVTTESLLGSVTKEMEEELGLDKKELTGIRLVAMAHDNIKPHTEVLYLAKTRLTFEEVRKHSESSNKNKGLAPEDLDEKFFDIAASPEAIKTLLSEVHCPLPPTHAAAFLACGYSLMLEKGNKAAADKWLNEAKIGVAQNYTTMDAMVAKYYKTFPGANKLVPERMWNKHVADRNLDAYTPAYTPSEQGLPDLDDELVRVGLVPEERRVVDTAYLFDVDGVLTNPTTKIVDREAIFTGLIDRLQAGLPVAFNTGRSTKWVVDNVVQPMLERASDPGILQNAIIVGEKGASWATFGEDGTPLYGIADSLSLPDTLSQAVDELASKYADTMGNLDPKQTMFSVEMLDGANIDEFHVVQAVFASELQALLDSHPEGAMFRVDKTAIATDVESRYVGKALGADRFLEFLQTRDLKAKHYVAFGDSPSDLAMAEELARRSQSVEMVYVGNPADIGDARTLRYAVSLLAGNTAATANFLQDENHR
ncbi:hypothetical protein IPL85_01890 [Candidatus Saccharibacteria bacterium]|nr:MAG: hypothetical protein IPL85_01890 [Candidatus Saccharibacteria bacterium]